MKRRILFVDDEPKVLQGLQRLLHPMRAEWEMRFVTSGEEALAVLRAEPFDVVVTDMRMPGIDGAELLERARQMQPQTVRIVLSGYSDRETVLRSVGTAHQYLAKPCDSELLRRVIRRACGLRQVLSEERLTKLVADMTTLPSLPTLYQRVLAELQAPGGSIHTVGELVAQDVGMTAKVLQLVNSAYFGLQQSIGDPVQATIYLGMETVRALVLAVGVFAQLEQCKMAALDLQAVEEHSMRVCALARQLAPRWRADARFVNETLMAGMLHDAGKLVLAANFPQEYNKAVAAARERRLTLQRAEEEHFGAGHAEVGAYLLGLWGLPDPVVEALAYHHRPQRCEGNQPSPLAAVHIANALDHAQEPGGSRNDEQLDQEYLERLGLSRTLPAWQELYTALDSQGVAP
ncbi:MAG: response regulator [bacterium]|jgi:HD-like signal output (HDOD) protein|nr:response regulator [candidate division KSB1 bacterium]MDH7559357.1 response regulator [bacterium]